MSLLRLNLPGIGIVVLLILHMVYFQSLDLPFSSIYEANYLAQPYDTKGILKSGLYIISYLLSALSIILLIFMRCRWLALFFIIITAVIFCLDLFPQFLGHSRNGLTVEGFSIAINETGRIKDIVVYKSVLLYSVLAFLIILVHLITIRYLFLPYFSIKTHWALIAYVTSLLLSATLVFRIPSILSHSYPAPTRMPIIIAEYFQNHSNNGFRQLDVSIQPSHPQPYKTIVWIIDESISGDYLSLNGYAKETTPYLSSISHENYMHNFGVVTPISNCSNTSNLFLRIGLTTTMKADFHTARNMLPTIFEYAQRAGFEVHLIDAQVASGEMQNHLTAADLKHINHHITFSRKHSPWERDQLLANHLREQLEQQDEVPRLVVAVKWGAHWPYPLSFPPQRVIFTPSAQESLTEMSVENKTILGNAYANALRYTVDDFFHGLLASELGNDQLIFYTADHGQSLFEKGDSPLTHCHYSTDMHDLPHGEFRVPLLVFTPEAKLKFNMQSSRTYTQEQMFATTLKLLGYDKQTYKKYGPTLFTGDARPYTESFILDSGLKIRFPKSKGGTEKPHSAEEKPAKY